MLFLHSVYVQNDGYHLTNKFLKDAEFKNKLIKRIYFYLKCSIYINFQPIYHKCTFLNYFLF